MEVWAFWGGQRTPTRPARSFCTSMACVQTMCIDVRMNMCMAYVHLDIVYGHANGDVSMAVSLFTAGLRSYGLHSCGPCSYDLYSDGPYSPGRLALHCSPRLPLHSGHTPTPISTHSCQYARLTRHVGACVCAHADTLRTRSHNPLATGTKDEGTHGRGHYRTWALHAGHRGHP